MKTKDEYLNEFLKECKSGLFNEYEINAAKLGFEKGYIVGMANDSKKEVVYVSKDWRDVPGGVGDEPYDLFG